MNNKLKILFFIPVWKRLHITELCYQGIKRIIDYAGQRAECDVLIVYSEDEHQGLAHQYGFKVVHADNRPLGAKFNKGLEHALKYEWDYLFQLNSDDLLSNRLFDVFYYAMQNKEPFASVEKLYIYDTESNKAKYYQYTASGCGIRIISREWVEGAGWHQYCEVKRSAKGQYIQYNAGHNKYLPVTLTHKAFINPLSSKRVFRLWEPERNKGLDNDSRNTLFAAFNEPVGWIKGVNNKPMVVDIKSGTNIWQYDDLQGQELSSIERNQLLNDFIELKGLATIEAHRAAYDQ